MTHLHQFVELFLLSVIQGGGEKVDNLKKITFINRGKKRVEMRKLKKEHLCFQSWAGGVAGFFIKNLFGFTAGKLNKKLANVQTLRGEQTISPLDRL